MKSKGGNGGFKSPDGQPTKKRRKNSNAGSLSSGTNSPAQQLAPGDLIMPPPPTSGYGDTIYASNPFDDSPPPSRQTNPMMGNLNQPPQRHNMNMGSPPGHMMCPNPGQMGQQMHPGQMQYGNMNMGPGMPPHSQQQMMGQPPLRDQWSGPPKPMPLPSSGKAVIYPQNQPMIFNPQNPNAPPIYPCGICQKEVSENDQAIPCESGCHFWFHRHCAALSDAAYSFLTQEVFAEWVCDRCLQTKNIPLVKFKP